MPALASDLRKTLEATVVKARELAERGARDALTALALGASEPFASMSEEERKLRNRLRAHGRQLGDQRDPQKGTQGIDCRVSNPRNKNQTITVVTFGRAGEDNKSFKLTDIETTVQGFAGADYDLQDAIALETGRTNGTREFNNEPYYDIQIDSPDVTYLITVTVNYGKVFALFVKTPTKLFQQDEEKLRRIQDTFRTL